MLFSLNSTTLIICQPLNSVYLIAVFLPHASMQKNMYQKDVRNACSRSLFG
jgi:hypothetical protein